MFAKNGIVILLKWLLRFALIPYQGHPTSCFQHTIEFPLRFIVVVKPMECLCSNYQINGSVSQIRFFSASDYARESIIVREHHLSGLSHFLIGLYRKYMQVFVKQMPSEYPCSGAYIGNNRIFIEAAFLDQGINYSRWVRRTISDIVVHPIRKPLCWCFHHLFSEH